MVKVTTKRRDEDKGEQNIFDALGLVDLNGPAEKKEEPDKDEPTVKDLLARIDGMQRDLEETRRVNMALSTAAPVSTAAPSKKVEIKDLPDPVANPEQFNAALNTQINSLVDSRVGEKAGEDAAERDRKEQANALWTDFATTYEDYAADEDRIEFVTSKVLEDARRRNLDTQRYVTANRDQFMRDVTKKYDKIFGKPGEEKPDPEDTTNEDNGRAASIFGGLESGGRPAGKREPGQTDLIEDMKAIQLKTGFY